VVPSRLLVQHAKFALHIMVSAGVFFEGKGRLHFVEKRQILTPTIDNLLPKLMKNADDLLGNNFVFQQDGAPVHEAMRTQGWLGEHCPDFIDNDSWPTNSPDLNPLDYCMSAGCNAQGIQQV